MLGFEAVLHWADACRLHFTPVFQTGAEEVTTSYRTAEISWASLWLGDGFWGGKFQVNRKCCLP